MKIKSVLFAIGASLVLSVFSAAPAFSQESSIEQNKAHILEDIETLQKGLRKTKDCVTQARTAADLERCREAEKIKRFEEVQDKLFEMGMSREERKMRRPIKEF
jgi:hypothetical protein